MASENLQMLQINNHTFVQVISPYMLMGETSSSSLSVKLPLWELITGILGEERSNSLRESVSSSADVRWWFNSTMAKPAKIMASKKKTASQCKAMSGERAYENIQGTWIVNIIFSPTNFIWDQNLREKLFSTELKCKTWLRDLNFSKVRNKCQPEISGVTEISLSTHNA